MTKSKVVIWIIVGVVAISLVGLTGVFSPGPTTSSQNGQSSNLSGRVPCLTSEIFHIHPKIKVLVNEKADSTGSPREEFLPANLGILPGCTREIHTHAADANQGIIHIESAVDRGYTLADFLSVWDKPLLREGYSLKVTVDGKETTDLNFVMKDGQQIVLEYTRS